MRRRAVQVHTAMDVPYMALAQRSEDAEDEIDDAGFEWLRIFMEEEPASQDSHQARLLCGPARQPLLAAVHHDRPTIAISCAATSPSQLPAPARDVHNLHRLLCTERR